MKDISFQKISTKHLFGTHNRISVDDMGNKTTRRTGSQLDTIDTGGNNSPPQPADERVGRAELSMASPA